MYINGLVWAGGRWCGCVSRRYTYLRTWRLLLFHAETSRSTDMCVHVYVRVYVRVYTRGAFLVIAVLVDESNRPL